VSARARPEKTPRICGVLADAPLPTRTGDCEFRVQETPRSTLISVGKFGGSDSLRPSAIDGYEFYCIAQFGRRRLASPVLDDQVFESPKILHVRGHDNQVIGAGNRRNLSVRSARRSTAFPQARAFTRVPGRGLLVIGKDRQNAPHDLFKVRLYGAALS
jgi:hypothetical protein